MYAKVPYSYQTINNCHITQYEIHMSCSVDITVIILTFCKIPPSVCVATGIVAESSSDDEYHNEAVKKILDQFPPISWYELFAETVREAKYALEIMNWPYFKLFGSYTIGSRFKYDEACITYLVVIFLVFLWWTITKLITTMCHFFLDNVIQ